MIPEIHRLLKFNKIKESEKILMEELSNYLLSTANSKQPTDETKWPKFLKKVI